MPLTCPTNSGKGDFDPIPAGSHIAVCDIVADIGVQPGSQLYPDAKRKIFIRFELPNERVEFEKDGKKMVGPRVIGKTYTASLHEKATLRHHLESWRGKQFTDGEAEKFDLSLILGQPCMLTVMQSQKESSTFSNIAGIGPLPKGIGPKTIIPEITPLLYYPPDSISCYAQLPEWLRDKIDGQLIKKPEPKPQAAPGRPDAWDGTEISDDDIPF
jgi:hypothetical protein